MSKHPLKIFKFKYLIVIIFISIIPVVPFFVSNDLLHTHDGLVHLPRLAAYFKALMDGNFPVRFAGFLNYGYGLPLFNFIYQTPYLIGSFLLLIGLSLVNAFKISLALSFILSGIFMYLFGKEYFDDERKGFLISIFYQFVPFRMVELLVRGSYGEVYTYTFFPLVLYGLILLGKKKSKIGFIITSLATALLIVSHNSVSLLFFAAILLFLITTTHSFKTFLKGVAGLFLGVAIAAFYWMPAILEHKYTYGNLFMQELYKGHFVQFQNFFIPNVLNLRQFQTEGITTFIGLFQVVALILSLILFIKGNLDKKTRRLFIFSYILFAVSLFFMLPISSPIWGMDIFSFLRQFQFPWRFLSLMVIATSMLAVSFPIIDRRFQKKFAYAGLVIFTVISVAIFWKTNIPYDKINQNYYWNFPLNTTYYGETDVIWSAGPAKKFPKSPIEIISGQADVSNFEKKNHYERFIIKSPSGATLVAHIQFFPGWKAYVNGKEVPVQFQDPNHRGLLVFSVPKGQSTVLLRFEESKIRFVADMISIFGLIMLIPASFFLKNKK